jgi:hypothetical protein
VWPGWVVLSPFLSFAYEDDERYAIRSYSFVFQNDTSTEIHPILNETNRNENKQSKLNLPIVKVGEHHEREDVDVEDCAITKYYLLLSKQDACPLALNLVWRHFDEVCVCFTILKFYWVQGS